MLHITNLVTAMKTAGFPLDAMDRDFMTEKEREFYYRECRRLGVKHSDEVKSAPVAPMDSRDLARANID